MREGNIRPYKKLEIENECEPVPSSYNNGFYTDDYYVFLCQSNSDYGTSVDITIWNKRTWDIVLKKTGLGTSTKTFIGDYIKTYTIYGNKIYFWNMPGSTSTSVMYEIVVDESLETKFEFNSISMPRKLTDYVPIVSLDGVLYFFGMQTDAATSISENTTYTSIVKFEPQKRIATVIGISTADMGFNAGTTSSSKTQSESGVYGAFQYGEKQILIIGKNADSSITKPRVILWDLGKGEYTNVSENEEFSYLNKLLINTDYFNGTSTSIKRTRNSLYADGLVKFTGLTSFTIKSSGNSRAAKKWYLISDSGTFVYLRLSFFVDIQRKRIRTMWTPEGVTSPCAENTYISTKWISENGRFTQLPLYQTKQYDLRASRIYDLNRKIIEAFSMDCTFTREKAVGTSIIDFVVYVKKGMQVKPFSEIPAVMEVKFIRPSNLSVVNLEPEADGFYEVNEELYLYLAIETERIATSSYTLLDGHPYSTVNPFKILVR